LIYIYETVGFVPGRNNFGTFCTTQDETMSAGGAVVINNILVISQLTNAISLQNEEAMELNNFAVKKWNGRSNKKRRRKIGPRNSI
jgi:hypothetical protein